MSQWANISQNNERFRLLCDKNDCSLSLANLDNGFISVTTIHGRERHSYKFQPSDMLFVISQYIKNMSPTDRSEFLSYLNQF